MRVEAHLFRLGVVLGTFEGAVAVEQVVHLLDEFPGLRRRQTHGEVAHVGGAGPALGPVVAGTGTIDADGKVGAVGGVALKTQAARRDGATVFLVPKAECSDAKSELPKGLRLIPVTTLQGSVDALVALEKGKGSVPSC